MLVGLVAESVAGCGGWDTPVMPSAGASRRPPGGRRKSLVCCI